MAPQPTQWCGPLAQLPIVVLLATTEGQGHAPVLLSGRKTTEEGQWAGPALAVAGLYREEAQVSTSFITVFFSIFLTYVLI